MDVSTPPWVPLLFKKLSKALQGGKVPILYEVAARGFCCRNIILYVGPLLTKLLVMGSFRYHLGPLIVVFHVFNISA